MHLVIFDCDGVLVESEAIYIAAEIEYLSRYGVHYEKQAYMRQYMGLAPREWKEILGKAISEQLGRPVEPDFFDKLDRFTMKRFEEELVAVQGAKAAIEQLEHQRCVASSSTAERLAWKLRHTGLFDLFDGNFFSSELVEYGKPEPDLFLHAAEAMGHSPAQCIVVEDSVNGVVAAKNAEMIAIGFVAGSHCLDEQADVLASEGADVVVGSYKQLLDVIALGNW